VKHINLARAAIIVAGLATAAMGAFHFLLPQLFGWGRFTQGLPAEIQWALLAMNAFLSLLLLVGGLASIVVVRRGKADNWWPVWIMGAFWIYNCGYQVVRPFPAPGIRWALLGFAVGVTLFYLAGLAGGGLAIKKGTASSDQVTQ
jgi:hypothetical protein